MCGNQLWRSPESWAKALQNTPSDMFSFSIMTIYVMLNDMVFRMPNEELKDGEAWRLILSRHISYFADEESFRGLLMHLGEDNPFFERLIEVASALDARVLFSNWEPIDKDLKDLIVKMTNLDPARRITAREALEHELFKKSTLEEMEYRGMFRPV
jgi:serine/threonine protein kinase